MPVAMAISRPEDFLSSPVEGEDRLMKHFAAHMGTWENFPKALVILGGFN
ncbi:hypothetical protein A2U01_0093020, partial [Trifolium medium]|nr:hypothetical protein [Trifolium medium]